MSRYVGTWNLEYFCPITHVGRTLHEDKDPPEGNGHVYQRLYHRHQLPAVTLMYPVCWNKLNVLLLKFVIWIAMKLTPAQKYEIYKFSTFANHYNPTIIHCEQKPNSIRQSFARQTFWHASFVKFHQTFPPSKFYAIR